MVRPAPLLIGAALGVILFVFVMLPALDFGLGIRAMIWALLNLLGTLALLVVATWIVASVWRAVQRR
ncbi:MAG TPA: hypothetical protein VFR68_06535 [Candidatus Dormibacteraeota bacterium]|nr:hypothetical protein [Candidatus Dormibacteraeota bacterium]